MALSGGSAAATQGILSLNVRDSAELYRHYMSFLDNGGLFVPTIKKYQLGDEVFLLVNLQSENERLPVPGTVCWITPPGAQGSRTAGIGITFAKTPDGQTARTKFESLLAAYGHGDQPTLTM